MSIQYDYHYMNFATYCIPLSVMCKVQNSLSYTIFRPFYTALFMRQDTRFSILCQENDNFLKIYLAARLWYKVYRNHLSKEHLFISI